MCGPRGGRSENRVSLAPWSRHPPWTFSHPWWLRERALGASACIAAPCRRRATEAALCAAVIVGRAGSRCLSAQVVHDERAARVLVFISRSAGMKRRMNRTEIGSRASQRFPERTPPLRIQIPLSHHRAFHAGAVLSPVNALRFASTRPAAGPSGIDDASARHDLGYCAMAAFLMARAGRESELTRDCCRRMLMYRVCAPTAHPPHRTRCMQSAFPVVALRARFKRIPQTSRQAAALSRCS